MKLVQRFSIFMIVLLAFTSVFAQKTKPAMGKTEKVYMCTHCDMAAMKAGKCSMCKMDMKKTSAIVTDHCDHCKMDVNAKGGMCPMCKGKTTKMATVYTCDHCHTSSTKSGKCSKCKMEMKKHSAKIM